MQQYMVQVQKKRIINDNMTKEYQLQFEIVIEQKGYN